MQSISEESGGTTTAEPPSQLPDQPTDQLPGPRAPLARGTTVQPNLARTPPKPSPRLPFLRLPAEPTHRRPGLRIVAALVVVLALAGTLVTGTGRADGQADRVRDALTSATTAVQEVATTTAPIRPTHLRGQLARIISLNNDVQAARGGTSWTLARWLTRPTRTGLLDRRAQGLALLAEAGRPLGVALVGATTGDPDADQLAALAASTAGYAAAARDSGIALDGGMRQLASAAAVLPGLAAAPGPRRFTVCPRATGRCEVLAVTEGLITSRRTLYLARVLRDAGSPSDVMITGVDPDAIVSGQHLSVTGLLDALLRSMETPASGAQAVTVRTVVPLVAP